jgi:hypothetical protein
MNLDCLEFIQNGIGAIIKVASLSLDDSSKMKPGAIMEVVSLGLIVHPKWELGQW